MRERTFREAEGDDLPVVIPCTRFECEGGGAAETQGWRSDASLGFARSEFDTLGSFVDGDAGPSRHIRPCVKCFRDFGRSYVSFPCAVVTTSAVALVKRFLEHDVLRCGSRRARSEQPYA